MYSEKSMFVRFCGEIIRRATWIIDYPPFKMTGNIIDGNFNSGYMRRQLLGS